jgi:hypothetical protein
LIKSVGSILLLLVLSACTGVLETDQAADRATQTPSPESTQDSPSSSAEPSPSSNPSASSNPGETSSPSSLVSVKAPQGSEIYEGARFTIYVEPDWRQAAKEPAAWAVGLPGQAETGSISAVTEPLPAPTSMSDYLAASLTALKGVVKNGQYSEPQVITVGGREYGMLEYEGILGASQPLKFLAIVNLSGENAAIATLAAPPDNFLPLRKKLLPYLTTIVAK